MPQTIRLSVRDLVEFVLRGGSIDNRFGGDTLQRALEGARIHRKLQKQEGEGYQAEVYLSNSAQSGEFVFEVEGRADGVMDKGGSVLIDEIKTTAAPAELITADYNRVHWAQAMCYGHFWCCGHETAMVEIRLTYYQIHTQQITRFTRTFTREALRDFYEDILRQYVHWAGWKKDFSAVRNASILSLAFPFPSYREGQRQMAVAVYRAVERCETLFCQAPTGIGKTISALFPGIKAMGEGKTEKIFYLTSKTLIRKAAEDALDKMRAGGLRLKSVTLTAKDKICFMEETDCNPEYCPYADGHFDRVNGAITDVFEHCDGITRERVEEYAKKHRVCPFELALDLTLWSDAVICDYNYLFDPTVYLKRFFSDGAKGSYTFLVDEAHNLPDRAREMYSAQLDKADILDLKKQLGKQERGLTKSLNQLNREFLKLKELCGEKKYAVQKEALKPLQEALSAFFYTCDEWLREHPSQPYREDVLDFYFEVSGYLKIAELYDERYVTFVEEDGRHIKVRQMCLDPSFLLRKCLDRGSSAVFFSATLTPLSYFCEVLGGPEDAKKYRLPSPFPKEHLKLLAADRVNLRYRYREQNAAVVASLIGKMVDGKEGNYMAFFPSYEFMQQVYEAFSQRYPGKEVLLQSREMEEQRREAFLECFQAGRQVTGFCVLGGFFSEGIDLLGDRLLGAAIVGVGLPKFHRQQDILRDYYQDKNGMGYQFAYQYPGMNKVLQAAGRVIRSAEDRGVVLLIDDRFTTSSYLHLFPEFWSHYERIRDESELGHALKDFWQT